MIKSTPVPKIVDHDERREELARAAVRAIDRLGLEGATMREIAKEAGYSTGILGHYFESKDDIVLGALRFMITGTLARLADICAPKWRNLSRTMPGSVILERDSRTSEDSTPRSAMFCKRSILS